MLLKRIIFLIVIFLLISNIITASDNDTIDNKKSRSIGLLPAIAYDADLGFQWGALANIYWYGKPSTYPNYQHSLYVEASRFKAGSYLTRVYYDSEKLLNPIRTTIDITFIRDQLMDFYGFNGYESKYYSEWEDDITNAFYKHHRDLFRILTNFKGPVSNNKNLQWVAGFTLFDMNIHSVELNKINKTADPQLPDTAGLYEKYTDWNIISDKEKNGGTNAYIKIGLSYDSRDFEANPSKGIFSELFISTTPSFLSSHHESFSRITAVHRQYITLLSEKTIFAYRFLYQKTIEGKVPFYLLPHIVTSSLGSATSQGLGGAKTLRGISRNRVVGDGIFLANVEVRQMIKRFNLFNQDFYVATNLFTDMGMVVQPYSIDLSQVPDEEKELYFSDDKEKLHTSLGLGLKIAMNENFIVSVDYGKAMNNQDGNSGIYIMLNYLF